MRKGWLLVLGTLMVVGLSSCNRKKGCTDPVALNYDSEAKVDCQCCEYDMTPKNFDGSLKLQFNLKNYLLSVNANDTLTDYLSRKYMVQDMVMYLSDIALVDAFSNEVPLRDIALVDFYSTENTSITVDSILQGSYSGIKFGIGVDSALNATGPAAWPFLHPLGQSNGAYHWGAKKYVFVRFGGRADLDSNGSMEQLFVYHTGTDSLYRKIEFNTPIVIVKGEETVIDLNINLDKIWVNGTDTIDITTEFTTHTTPGDPLAKKFTDQFKNALSE